MRCNLFVLINQYQATEAHGCNQYLQNVLTMEMFYLEYVMDVLRHSEAPEKSV